MIIVISPSKTLDFSVNSFHDHTFPRQLNNSQELINTVKQFTVEELASLMKISEKLSQLNWQRYRDFQQPFTLRNAKQALLAFKGDVYGGIDVENYTANDFAFAQSHLRILSGLYGCLRPLDLIQPYRLEMGTKLANDKGKNLYEYWGEKVTALIDLDLENDENPLLINLASNEYYKVIKPKLLNAQVLTLNFKENKAGVYKTIGIHAKRARGLMTNFIIINRLTKASQLKRFNDADYVFNDTLSSEKEWVFSRG
ncbi:MAG: peroxide stress protein YaaA [Methylococcales symbiont of Iophon sp. n. MRB-2018]|nr:MAG: peroxide stress protein YaaA [Methylococcales symbiont of Iophon sp. n. MRB-2018]KAF3979131.1 MAG: peroxide stress protein YaaA [Methylococcales symbiont of Iophon sp. n. MRB-2018]